MSNDKAGEFATAWIEAWNAHDMDRILAHYAEDVTFSSPRAELIVGEGRLSGKAALEAYWRKALGRQPELRFELDEVRVGYRCLTILYRNHRQQRAAETFEFDESGQVTRSCACYAPAGG
jgi:ketosteroid isomerase-like protein